MVSIYQIKPKFQALLRPFTNGLASLGVTANQVTIFAAILSIITGVLIYFYGEQLWPLLLVPIILLVRMALNAIDGMLARDKILEEFNINIISIARISQLVDFFDTSGRKDEAEIIKNYLTNI